MPVSTDRVAVQAREWLVNKVSVTAVVFLMQADAVVKLAIQNRMAKKVGWHKSLSLA
jgi:hypothetical protein